jgi:dihydrofolate reductase
MTITINVIAAVDDDFGIGKDGKIPWHYKEDFKYFKNITMNNVVIMGRSTFDEIVKLTKSGNPLDGRQCIIISSTTPIDMQYDNVVFVNSILEAVSFAKGFDKDIFFIGGERIFKDGLCLSDFVFLTKIPDSHNCDRFFPIEILNNKYVLLEEKVDSSGLIFCIYCRKKGK